MMVTTATIGQVALRLLETDWGWIGLASTGRGLCGLTLPQEARDKALQAMIHEWPSGELGTMASRAVDDQLRRYFRGEPVCFDVALDLPSRPPFWRCVWQTVAEIPYGQTRSYGEVARKAGSPAAARAVGAALAHNPVAIIVPCHRVVGSDGRLVGFGGGLAMKQRLLEMERQPLCGP